MTASIYWKNALIRAARTFIQGFLGGLSANLLIGNEAEMLYAAFMDVCAGFYVVLSLICFMVLSSYFV